ncbi:MAG: prolyl oligopeptidase family serine peptidase, partial [Pirellula sp.]|nr:prolyl oligopeptidase family serine peptidase [Pirellula sp.]
MIPTKKWLAAGICRFLSCGLVALLFAIQPLGAQEWPLVGETVEPQWSSDGNQFWFQRIDESKKREFLLVDANQARREPLFDHSAAVTAIQEKTGLNEQEIRRSWKVAEYSDSSNTVTITVARNQLKIDRSTGSIEWLSTDSSKDVSSNLFLPARPSQSGGESVSFKVDNQLADEIEVLWVNNSGELVPYGTASPGESFGSGSYAGHVWMIRSKDGKPIGCVELPDQAETIIELNDAAVASVVKDAPRRRPNRRNRGRNRNPDMGQPADRSGTRMEVRDHDLWIVNPNQRDGDGDASNLQPSSSNANLEVRITFDANEKNSFRKTAQRDRLMSMQYRAQDPPASVADVDWSPSGEYAIAWQTTVVPERIVKIVHALPKEGQPALVEYPYAKPGDAIPCRTPRLIDVKNQKEIPLDKELFPDPWEVRLERFSEDGKVAWFHYNARGHQVIRVVRVDLASGEAKTIIDENSKTFLHYSDGGKYQLSWLDDATALWSSERSGWNHLYRIDMNSGNVINTVTRGDWNVKRIEEIRDQNVFFYAVGLATNQDPYHEHFCRVSIDGTGFVQLTDGDGNHSVQWSPNRDYILDRYSRVDMPPVHELRRASDGKLVAEVERADYVGLNNSEQRRLHMPERFVAPGRDGKTPIWGIVHWPKDFDPTKSYPVIESIYAGPHDHHVPKNFQRGKSHREFTAAGFVVVEIDGMGTAWRSKEFHDVCYRNLKDAGFPDRIAWMKELAKKYPSLDLTRVGVFGGSAGGQNAMAALLWYNDFYKAAVADCGCHDNRMDKIWWNEQWMGTVEPGDHYSQNSNVDNAHLLQGKLMLVVGELDRNVDPASTTQAVAKLIEANKDFDFLLMS